MNRRGFLRGLFGAIVAAPFVPALLEKVSQIRIGEPRKADVYFDINSATAILKEFYSGQIIQPMVYEANPFLAMIPKKNSWECDRG